ncbi:MAG TPA: Gfo/Idh/MocA family oxidoreductase [Roseiarcus sp.]
MGQADHRDLAKSKRFQVVCGVDPAPPAGTAQLLADLGIALESDLQRALARADVEGVILATPHALHEEQCLAVLAHGKELFCEKPLTMTGAGAARVLDACERAGKVLGIGHERRFEPGFEELGRIIASGALGKLIALEANVSHDILVALGADNWRHNASHAPAGLMTGVGVHLTDLFIAFAGPIVEVNALTASVASAPSVMDYTTARLAFASGARGTLTTISRTPFYGRFTVFGEAAWVELVSEGNVDQGLPTRLFRRAATALPRKEAVFEPLDTVTLNFEAWAAAVAGETPYRFTRQQIQNNVEVFEAIVTSAREAGRTVAISQG